MRTKIVPAVVAITQGGADHMIHVKRRHAAPRLVQLGQAASNRDQQYRRVATVLDTGRFAAEDWAAEAATVAEVEAWDFAALGEYFTPTTPGMVAAILKYGPWRACNR